MTKQRYNHALTIAFTVVSEHPLGEDITNQQIYRGILNRLVDLMGSSNQYEIQEAVQPPYDTYPTEEEPR
jgi:hypothetical protein